MRIELHCHTYYSKGSKITWESPASPRDVIKAVKKKGLDGVAITDHRNIKAWKEAKEEARKQGILFIPGVELSTASGHVLALGISEMVDNYLSLEETVDRIHDQGGIAIAAHPYDLKGEGVRDGIKHLDVVEVFNSLNLDGLSNLIALRKAKEMGKPMSVGSDAHTTEMLGSSVNLINGYDVDSVLKNLKRGRAKFEFNYARVDHIVRWARERMTLSYGDIVRYVDMNYGFVKRHISKPLLRKFIVSESRVWLWLAKFSFSVSRVYAHAKLRNIK